MKNIKISRALFFAFAFAAHGAWAQGTLYINTLGPSSLGGIPVGSNAWVAAGIFTGNNAAGYTLDSVQLALTDASGNPNGFTVMVYGNDGGQGGINPGSSVGTLDGSLSPVAGGIYTFTPVSEIEMLPHTQYYVVLTSGTAIANGAYGWSYISASSYEGVSDWNPSVAEGSINGAQFSWEQLGVGPGYELPQFALYATPVPEPSARVVFLMGGGFLVYMRRERRLHEKYRH